jgi:hypothetical protein
VELGMMEQREIQEVEDHIADMLARILRIEERL